MNTRLEKEIKKTTIRFILASIILLTAAVFLSMIWNRSIKDELAIQASSFVRKGISSTELRGVIEYLNGVQFSAFKHVSLFTANDDHIITLPPVFDRRARSATFLTDLLYSSISIPIYLDTENRTLVAKAKYTYLRFELVPYAILIWLLSAMLLALVFVQAKKKLVLEFEKEVRIKNAELSEEIAKKVRHNIRSPLASLRAIFIEKMFSPEMILEQGLGVIKRLEEIVEELRTNEDPETKSSANSLKLPPIYDVRLMLKSIVAEKRLLSKDIQLNFIEDNFSHQNGVFTSVSGSDFSQLLSNTIDNSLQAIVSYTGNVDVHLSSDEAAFTVEIRDNGHGIEREMISKVFDKHFTFGKKDGTGLGLYFAKKLVESNFGNIEINSTYGEGTSLTITLPKVVTPSWYLRKISVNEYDEVVLCDDQSTLIDALEMKLNRSNEQFLIKTYSYCEQINVVADDHSRTLYLVDFDLGREKMTGIDFLTLNRHLAKDFILVTGHYDDPKVQADCQKLGCKLLAKDSLFQIDFN